MQVVLAILVALVQVAGPWLCCCGPARLFGSAQVSIPAAVAQAEPEPEPACPHCKAAKQTAKSIPAPAKQHPCPDDRTPDRCPCGGVAYQQPPAVVSEAGLDFRFEPSVLVATFLPAAELLLPGQPAGMGHSGGVSDLPFLTTEHRLFVHHALRC